jgi:hypothetical protein
LRRNAPEYAVQLDEHLWPEQERPAFTVSATAYKPTNLVSGIDLRYSIASRS